MFKRVMLLVALATGMCALLTLSAMAQSKEEVIKLLVEARSIQKSARSNEDLGKAVEKYRQVLKIFERQNYQEGVAAVAQALGLIYHDLQQYPEAVKLYERAVKAAKQAKNVQIEGECLGDLAIIYTNRGEYAKAEEILLKNLAICEKLSDLRCMGNALGNLGNVYGTWGQLYHPKAKESFERSLAIFKKLGDLKGEEKSLSNLANIYDGMGQGFKALELYEQSLELGRKLQDLHGEGLTLMNLGNVHSAWGQYSAAVNAYNKSLEIVTKFQDHRAEANALTNLGIVYSNWGQYSSAVKAYERSLQIYRNLGDTQGEGQCLMHLGRAYVRTGEYDKAQASFNKSMDLYSRIGLAVNEQIKLRGDLHLDAGELEKAWIFVQSAGFESSLGRLCLLKSDYQSARKHYEALLKSAEKLSNVDHLFTACTGLGTAYESMGDDSKAAEYYHKAVNLTDELRSGLSREQRRQFFGVRVEGFYRTTPYKRLARTLMRMNRPVDALRRSEETKARAFADGLSRWSEEKRFDVPPEVLTRDVELMEQLAAAKRNRQKEYERGNHEVIAALDPQIQDMEKEFAAHKKMLRDRYPLFAATKYPEPMDLSQTALKANEWVLEYDVTDSGILIYLTKGKKIVKALFKPVREKEVDDLVGELRQTVVLAEGETVPEKVRQFDFSTGKKVADLLLEHILPYLPKGVPLIIVPDGQLGVIPFEMLVLNDGGRIATDKDRPYVTGAELFGDRNPISYYQSITALTLARTLGNRQKPGERLLVLVDPIFSRDDPRLAQYDKQKKQELLDTLPTELPMAIQTENRLHFLRLKLTKNLGESLKAADPSRTDLYEGVKAQKSILLEKDLTGYRSIVFGTHGYFGNALAGIQEPVLSLTLIGQPEGKDGFLRMSEVMKLKMSCDIVALTACQSGLGHQISGEGTMGMGRAFQYAGARSVLMSLWTVAERSSVMLVESFFKHLREGKSKLESLRLARNEIRKAGYDHPFFWAPFILVGEVD